MKTLLLLGTFLVLLQSHAQAASVTYSAFVDTSTLTGTTGSLDFNFQPGPFGSQAASVQIIGFGGDGTFEGSPAVAGSADGTLPGNLVLGNGTGFNDYFQTFTFGSSLDFMISLSGPALTPPAGTASGSTFAFSIFSDVNGTVPALTSDTTNGYAITVDINPDGSTTLRNYTASVTPEPSSGILAATGALFAGLFLYRVGDDRQMRRAWIRSRPQ